MLLTVISKSIVLIVVFLLTIVPPIITPIQPANNPPTNAPPTEKFPVFWSLTWTLKPIKPIKSSFIDWKTSSSTNPKLTFLFASLTLIQFLEFSFTLK